jgi:prophage regulatory protein
MPAPEAATETMLKLPAVIERTGLSRPSIYRLMGIGLFPRNHRLAIRAVGWKRSEIEKWMDSRTLA